MSSFAMFYLQDASLLEFQRSLEKQLQANNLRTGFGIEQIPGDSQLLEIIDEHNSQFFAQILGTIDDFS
jgi:hypothetical protein